MAMGDLMVLDFAFKGQTFRILKNGDPWFVLADICQILGHTNPSKAAQALDADEKGLTNSYTLGGNQRVLIISEPGFYKLVSTSRKPWAREFDRLVRHEILPSIRKTGGFQSGATELPALEIVKDLFCGLEKKVQEGFGKLQQTTDGVADNVIALVRTTSDTNQLVRDFGPKRPKVPPKTIRLLIEVIELPPYYGHCPIYPEIEIVRNGERILGSAELDHTEGRDKNALKYVWLTSLLANQHLRNPDFRKLHRGTFEAFQNNLRLHLEYKKRKQKEHQRGLDQSLTSFNPDRAMTADEMRSYKQPRLSWDK